MEGTRIIDLKIEKLNKHLNNDCTMFLSAMDIHEHRTIEQMFKDHFYSFKNFMASCSKGVAIFAISHDSLAAQAFIKSKKHTINSLIIGRHGMCELYLAGDPQLSLRHLALLLYPENLGFRFRLLDLRSSFAFENEKGESCLSVESTGPLFIRLGSFTLFFLPTSLSFDAASTAAEAWKALPSRLYEERKTSSYQNEESEPDISSVISLPAPQQLSSLDNGPKAGELELFYHHRRMVIPIARGALQTGILLGRYQRCEALISNMLDLHYISRVHLLIVELAGKFYVVDTGSTNGSFFENQRITQLELGDYKELLLGDIQRCKQPIWMVWKAA